MDSGGNLLPVAAIALPPRRVFPGVLDGVVPSKGLQNNSFLQGIAHDVFPYLLMQVLL
jgi:hypothetical protein